MRISGPFIRPLGWGSAIIAVSVAGLAFRLAFPAPGLWWTAPLALTLWLVALAGRGFWSGFGLSLIGGLAFWLSLVNWTALYLGPLPWIALGSLMALYMAIGGGFIAWLWRWTERILPPGSARTALLTASLSSAWIGREWLAASWPYGGFSWGRIAMSQSEGWFAPALSWWGASGLGWAIAAISAFAAIVLTSERPPASRLRDLTLRWALAIAVLGSLPVWPVATSGSIRVLAVQGGADASLFTALPRGTVFNAHIEQTLASEASAPELVVWPENAADIDPLESAAAAAALDQLAQRFEVPFLVGAVNERDGAFYNSSLLWTPEAGVTALYDKAHPVPFAEYMPDRAFWRPFAPDLIDLINRDYQAGTRANVLDLPDARGGVAICFDIAYDDLIADMMAGRAELILAQTNNADFGRTDESIQQLAIARMRAIETGRTVVNISTVGSSAIIRPDGSTEVAVPTWEPGSLVADVPLAQTPTLATLITPWLSVAASAFAPLVVAALLWCRVRGYWSSSSSPRRERSQSSRS
ncbi:MAG TPA: apolipoprotein N-acyltransferase [Microbacteriaceae bacterium]|nr:apolipoprotein N-acyltransferase [Microbacteriaceae bacterium]